MKLPSPEPRAGKAGKSGNKHTLKEELQLWAEFEASAHYRAQREPH